MRLRTSRTTALLTGLLAALAAAVAAPPGLGTPPAHAAGGGRAASGDCDAGQLCLWPKADFGGARRTYELSGTDIESCVPLPEGSGAAALANRTGRPVTTYQSVECAETAEFDTYPGGGSWVPRSPYRVRAFKVWER
ncbi:peptidase inhibitor family I36 protein [Streptomyces sp. Je 1-4]|uniref:peptidase inhibitor family I36 protein n=1 Tax=Streptomyces TaxID=1883 RepID=UPI00140F39CA|nr:MULTISPECIES: peptidase inhibitor family I36 protein [unclassified Streptomyces]QIK08946.1 peptidase inhibitor family I36 protein [Streptomyces sp. ID38640]UYB42637.1 peptidase inhibitor family I36 protein [Streptomyces sp. Je 1-4]UZQ38955.1 peptidase inhibitor family I36 protein [Streptomyces sp. Je 1-4] [Streptomyces sp. Je 1-4 4N24]UZQ46372.1 peptidase inhibitor family I36 protein [Streptomyces sp. Je 1-4] [Streptomyces sp. Je 1-4 4N24_ara]